MNMNDQIPTSSVQTDQLWYASLALEITEQDWSMLGMEDNVCPDVAASESLESTAERVTALLLVRLVALAAPSHIFQDLSTTTVCQSILQSRYVTSFWPETISVATVVQELRYFVMTMLQGYNQVSYHNFEHAYHVIVSANKMMDLMLQSTSPEEPVKVSSTSLRFKEDPLMHLGLLFAALIHDVEHQGVPNKQLELENHPLAIQYNDQSIAEQRSLTIGFTELLKPDYDNLRQVMFPFTFSGDGYRRFRATVTNLLLATDIASSDRGDVVKKRWEAAFQNSRKKGSTRVLDTKRRARRSSIAPAIQPPKDHPTPNRPRRKLVRDPPIYEGNQDLSTIGISATDSWVELGGTPSTHFPTDPAGPSMHDSLEFWWFCPNESDDEEELETHSFSEDDTAFGPTSTGQDMTLSSSSTLNEDFDTSISLFPESERDDPSTSAEFSDAYDFPHASKGFQFSCSTFGEESFQHLLSPSKVSRLSKIVSQCASNVTSSHAKDLGAYCDLSIASGNDAFLESKPKSLLGALSSCTPKRKARKKETMVLELESMIAKSSTADSMSSMTTADITVTDGSSGMASSSKIRFDPEQSFSCNLTCATEATPSSIPEEVEEEEDHELSTMSLLEHILLVSDVAHTMQGWDNMNKFAHRLLKEIQASIAARRSGGLMDDPLSDWYTNQSAFLHGYVLPLAQRLEKTGFVPLSEDQAETFLSTQVQSNLNRWQEQGHDIVSGWRKEREEDLKKTKDKTKKKKKRRSKKRSSKGGEKKTDKIEEAKSKAAMVLCPITHRRHLDLQEENLRTGNIQILEPFAGPTLVL